MNICTKLAFATAGLALGLTINGNSPVLAATISYNFVVNVTSGSLSGNSLVGNKYKGSFNYDDLTLEASEASAGELRLNFNFFGHYTEEDDNSYPDYPVAYFDEKKLLGLDYLSYKNHDSVLRLYLDTFYFATGADSVEGNVTYSLASIDPTPVPEPNVTLELGLLSFIGWLLKKRIILSR